MKLIIVLMILLLVLSGCAQVQTAQNITDDEDQENGPVPVEDVFIPEDDFVEIGEMV